MNKTFTYSILQYKHSLLLREAINVGIIFYFPTDGQFQFVSGNHQRVKSIYLDFDLTVYNSIVNRLKKRLKTKYNLFEELTNKSKSFQEYLNSNVLAEDATVLQFTEPIISVDTFNDIDTTVKKFSELLLPGIITASPVEDKRNEQFLLKTYLGYILAKDNQAENKISKNRLINYRGLTLNFDYYWKLRKGSRAKTTNLVKPISFDLKEPTEIQKKSVEYFGYLELLKPYADKNDVRFDLLIAKPKDENLLNKYEEAIRRIKKAKSAKRLITESELSAYSDETVQNLVQLEE
jgi:hypothetical protein